MTRTDELMDRALGARASSKVSRCRALAASDLAMAGTGVRSFGDLQAIRQLPMGRLFAQGPDVADHFDAAIEWVSKPPEPEARVVELAPTAAGQRLYAPLARLGFVCVRSQSMLEVDPGSVAPPDQPAVGVVVQPVHTADERAVFADLYEQGFRSDDDDPITDDERAHYLRVLAAEHASAESCRLFIATVDGAAVAMGSLWIDGRRGFLGNSATLPEARRRGAHAALIHARLAAARELQLESVAVDTRVNSPSERNLMRIGFDLVTHYTLWKSPAPGA